MFIVLEGLDGAGTTTQAALLADTLKSKGHGVMLTKEPTDQGPIGTLIRRVLQKEISMDAEALQLLFCADRAEHLRQVIQPALSRGDLVISDRYFYSTVAYGSLAVPDTGWLYELNRRFLKPDLVFFLSIDPKESLERIQKRGDATELFEQEEKLTHIQQTYDSVMQREPNVIILKATDSIESIASEILSKVEQSLSRSHT